MPPGLTRLPCGCFHKVASASRRRLGQIRRVLTRSLVRSRCFRNCVPRVVTESTGTVFRGLVGAVHVSPGLAWTGPLSRGFSRKHQGRGEMSLCGSCLWNSFLWGWWNFVTAHKKKPSDHSQELEEEMAVIRVSANKLGYVQF